MEAEDRLDGKPIASATTEEVEKVARRFGKSLSRYSAALFSLRSLLGL